MNFRLLREVELNLENSTTVIVGRNNSGKTSLTEIFRRLLSEKTPNFSIYDFNSLAIELFKKALSEYLKDANDEVIRSILPIIEIRFEISYDPAEDLGLLGDFIIDLNPACKEVVIFVRYELQNGKIKALFEGIPDETEKSIDEFLKQLKDRIPNLYKVNVSAQDPNDDTNTTNVDYIKFKQLIGAGFINAQRGLDDITHTEKDVLGKVLAKLFKTASLDTAPPDLKLKSEELDKVIKEIQEKVDTEFKTRVDDLLPVLKNFGYPGLTDPNLSTETNLDIGNILDTNTKIRYSQGNGLYLPESYNGLGSRNLIYILFQLFEFFRDWQSRSVVNNLCVVFIEEPEAHLHPQMQQVFIKQLDSIAKEFSNTLNQGVEWPVQFIVTTHSTHIANEAEFESIRYFLTIRDKQQETKIKDLRSVFISSQQDDADKKFLHKYLTLTKCDLFFADKAILIEGPSERILMPVIIEKTDSIQDGKPILSTQYLSIIEVGGAYAHHFYKFLDFLELKTLIITDIDSVSKVVEDNKTKYKSSIVSEGTHSTNSGIKNWFARGEEGYLEINVCTTKTFDEKATEWRRITYQIPEEGKTCCGRSFEEAFILANPSLHSLKGTTDHDLEMEAELNSPNNSEKTTFALHYAIEELNWVPPLYMIQGLKWLAEYSNSPVRVSEVTQAAVVEIN